MFTNGHRLSGTQLESDFLSSHICMMMMMVLQHIPTSQNPTMMIIVGDLSRRIPTIKYDYDDDGNEKMKSMDLNVNSHH